MLSNNQTNFIKIDFTPNTKLKRKKKNDSKAYLIKSVDKSLRSEITNTIYEIGLNETIELYNNFKDSQVSSEDTEQLIQVVNCHLINDIVKFGNFYYNNSDYLNALAFYEKAVEIDDEEVSLIIKKKMAFCYESTKQYSQALMLYIEFLNKNKSYIQLHLKVAKLFYLNQNYDKAFTYYTSALALDFNEKKALEGMGNIIRKKPEFAKSCVYNLESVLKLDPNNQNVLLFLGEIYESQGNYERAVEKYTRLTAIDPNNKTYAQRLSDCRIQQTFKKMSVQAIN